jgi:hypothetical protein
MSWEQEWGRRKPSQANKSTRKHKWSPHKSKCARVDFETLSESISWIVSLEWCLLLLYWMWMSECLDGWSGRGCGVFIAPTTNLTVGEAVCRWAHRTVRCATGHCPVHQPRHPTVRVMTVLTVGALTSWGTGQSSAAPDKHCSLSGEPSGGCSDSARTVRAL